MTAKQTRKRSKEAAAISAWSSFKNPPSHWIEVGTHRWALFLGVAQKVCRDAAGHMGGDSSGRLGFETDSFLSNYCVPGPVL